ncbi:hypothetical protein GYMLUDRAFT_264859 [Collybiopsis luxurians FD-317 M1]|uniref:Nitronate monooxygenase domain-containing protein n=1 Tax=Collybiopsis luxurians FD-317 M1 TaxID=944289 RepID=A0A0D0C7X3_9AGAR|nr:hypothetical protein GYMLUDRAFT_264859 [Collybiopsis luxurians FD-317 M1]
MMIYIETKLTKLLGTQIPIVSAPMYYATTPAMAATATDAGAFGFIAAGFTSSSALVDELKSVRTVLSTAAEAPIPVGVGFIGWILDQTETSDDPRIPAVLAERPVAIWFAFGVDLGKYVARVRQYDAGREHRTLIFVIVNSVDEAVRAANEWGVDVIVVQGNEAGGHGRGDSPTLHMLLPAVLAAVTSGPVILAAGGISTGKQVAAVLAMGADGVVLGSRLLGTPECMYLEQSKEVIFKSKLGSTIRSDVFDEINHTAFWPEGYDGRAIANDILGDHKAGLTLEERLKRYEASKLNGESNRLVIWAGDAIAYVNDNTTTKAIIHQLHDEAVTMIQSVAGTLNSSAEIAILILGLWLFSPFALRRIITNDNGDQVPPGPNIRYFFLRKYAERPLRSWAKQYGRLFSIWMGTQLVVVISDPKVARDLLVTNGAVFSTRKRYFMKNQTILRGRAITASEYGETWRQHRKLAMTLLTPKAIDGYSHSLNYESHILMRSLLDDGLFGEVPVNPHNYAGRYALNNMLYISFGIRTDFSRDPLVERALQLAMEFMDLTGPWSNVVDFFEPLQWIPSRMRSRGRKLHDNLIEVYGSMILRVKAKLDSGDFVPECLVKTLIQDQEKEKLDWEDLCMLSAVFTLGGVHSTSGIIQWFLALIPSHPEVVHRAQEELDRVVGRDRLPTAEDEANLPYIRAVIKEVQRVHAPFWMATPHCSSEDFTYEGHFIPKNTLVVLNCWTLHHNEERYKDAMHFNPDRYLGDNLSCAESAKLANVMERDHWTFGAGRRICPGIHVAERELWLAISQLLWSFNFHALPEEPISLKEYEGLSGRTPLPFRLIFEPRHDQVHPTLRENREVTYWTL